MTKGSTIIAHLRRLQPVAGIGFGGRYVPCIALRSIMVRQFPLLLVALGTLLGCGGMTDNGPATPEGAAGTDHGKTGGTGGGVVAGTGAGGTDPGSEGNAKGGAGATSPTGAAGAHVTGAGGATKATGAGGAKTLGTGGAKTTGAGGGAPGGAGAKDAGTAGSGSPDASKDGATPAKDSGSSVECNVSEDCTWGEISREIVVAADCMCLYGCPWIAMNQTTAARRQAQHAALCDPQRDGNGQPCGIDDCAMLPPIACVNHECQVAAKRAGQACTSSTDCGAGFTCFAKAAGGYCLPGTADQPTNCGEAGVSCPSGTACSPMPWGDTLTYVCLETCTTDADCRSNYRCDYLQRYPGHTGDPRSSAQVCWTACTPGVAPSCNDNPAYESIHGTCSADGTCQCSGYALNPSTGRCN